MYTDDEREAREIVEAKVGRKLSAADWHAAEKEHRWFRNLPAYDEVDIAAAVSFFHRPDTSKPLPARSLPADWLERSRRVFAHFKSDHEATLGLFGLDAPLPWADLEGFLQTVVADERAEGERGLLGYTRDGEWAYFLPIWRGITETEAWEHVDRGDTAWLNARTNRLWRVRGGAERIAGITGCDACAVVVYLLCGVTPLLPWVSVTTHTLWAEETGTNVRYTIKVGSPEVPLDTVREAYRRARSSAFGQVPTPKARREGTRRVQELLSFCEEAGAGKTITWAAAYSQWSALHSNDRGYKTAASFQRSYRNAKKREDARRGKGTS